MPFFYLYSSFHVASSLIAICRRKMQPFAIFNRDRGSTNHYFIPIHVPFLNFLNNFETFPNSSENYGVFNDFETFLKSLLNILNIVFLKKCSMDGKGLEKAAGGRWS